MTTITASKAGNWSDSTVWNGGVLPGAAGANDDADSNAFTVTIDQTINLNGGALIGTNSGAGGFSATAARTITANITSTVRTVLTMTHTTGTTTITGNLVGGSAASCIAATSTGAGIVTIVGNITGGSNASAYGYHENGASSVVNVTGNITGGANGVGLFIAAGTSLTMTGNCTGGTTSGSHGLNVSAGTPVVSITGNAYGGTNLASAYGVTHAAASAVTITGSAVGGLGGFGANNSGAGSLTVGRAIGNLYGPGGTHTNIFAGIAGTNNGSSVNKVYAIEYGAYGQTPTLGPALLLESTSVNVAQMRTANNGAFVTMIHPSSTGALPAIADVRNGTTYSGGMLTGTAYIPGATSVAAGVNVDHTVGTAVITTADVATAVQTGMTSQGYTTARAGYLDVLNGIIAAINAEVVDVMRTDTIPDSVSVDGSLPTLTQAIYEILQFLTEKSLTSTTLTVKKVNGSSALMTFTLDSATAPTSITRAT